MKNKVDKFSDAQNWDNYVGKQIVKRSGKPFKSGNKVGVVENMSINPNTGRKAFLMRDDQTLVDCHQCQLLIEVVETNKIL